MVYSIVNKVKGNEFQHVGTFRRILPQVLGSLAKNLMIINIGEFIVFSAIVIPSLTGLANDLNPDETILITSEQVSWLTTFSHIAHPIGSLMSGPINDRFGRRKAIMMVNIPLTICWIILGFTQTFPLICLLFSIMGFCFGLKEAPSLTYITEICEPSVRGTMITINNLSLTVGMFITMAFGSVLSWRHVAFVCALFPMSCVVAVTFVPETPSWLLSKGRIDKAQQSLQWLRGWVTPQTVQREFDELCQFSDTSNACNLCATQKIKCNHPPPTVIDKIKQLKQRRNIKPFVLVVLLEFFGTFNGSYIWDPYIIQVLNAYGTPIKSNYATILTSGIGVVGSIFLLATIKKLGRRRMFLITSFILAICCFGLSAYGFAFFGFDWTSFKKDPNESPKNPDAIRQIVGNFSYLAFAFILIAKFCGKTGVEVMSYLYAGEIFPFQLRSFLVGIALAVSYLQQSIATKTYYNLEMFVSLPGAIMVYGINTVVGLIVMYFIMPDTEQRSLEDIELHYSDKTKGMTDIHIEKRSAVA